jgi:hypothetical protein
VLLFWILAALRFASCLQFVVDDDEAWWSVAARALKNPFEYYLRAVDHKPPGIVWFYWGVDRLATLVHAGSDPRLTRAVYAVLLMIAALLLGKLAVFFAGQRRTNAHSPRSAPLSSRLSWATSCFFLIASAMASPKLLAITADGLLVIFVIAAYATGLLGRFRGRSIAAGALLGCALLVKQTAIFFAIPILIAAWPKRFSVREILGFALGASLVYVPAAVFSHLSEFYYWNLTYPAEVLTRARGGSAFDANAEMLSSISEFSFALFPLILFSFYARCVRFLRDFRLIWLVSALAGTFLGRGLFLHYFILALPPVCLLAADGYGIHALDPSKRLATRLTTRFGLSWLLAGYIFACGVVAIPFSGLFWGNDLAYYQAVGSKIEILISGSRSEPVLIWGGTALPLTFSGATFSGRFLIPRFAEPPYETALTQAIFHRELKENFPHIVVDLHERGDNRFNNSLQTDPFIFNHLAQYKVYIAPSLPWVKFYLDFTPPLAAGLTLLLTREDINRVYLPYPAEREEWNQLKPSSVGGLGHILALEKELRNHDSNVLVSRQGRAEYDEQPFPLRSRLWWAQSAIVELQPKFFNP